MKVIVWGYHEGSQAEAIDFLVKEGSVEVVRWIRNTHVNRELTQLIHRPFDMHFSFDEYPSEEVLRYFHPLKFKFLEMYSRVTISQSLDVNEQSILFEHYVKYFYNLFIKTKPDTLIMGSPPHFGVDLILYHMAVFFDLKISVALQTLFDNRFYAVNRIEGFGNIPLANSTSLNVDLNAYRNKQQFYMKKVKTYNKSCWLSWLNNAIFGRRRVKPIMLSAAFKSLQLCKIFKKNIKNNSLANPDLSKKFVYVPLQLQPEMTTSTLGGDLYTDQLNMVEQLLASIPKDVKIYVKENPKQTPRQRSQLFYKRLMSDKRVVYISPKFSSQELINHSTCVAVVSGTAGWEAILSGKPCLTFGYAWFNNLPGVFRYKSGINLEHIFSEKICERELKTSLNLLLESFNKGVIDPNYKVIVKDYSDDKNREYLIDYLQKLK